MTTTDTLQGALDELALRFGDQALAPPGPAGFLAIHPTLDAALGGGIPRGRITEVYGPEGAAKTTIGLWACASAQADGQVALFVDTEHALDLGWARRCGVDTDALLVSQPDHAEQALQTIDILTPAVGVVVLDSVAALLPKAELEGAIGQGFPGRQALLVAEALRKLVGPLARNRVAMVATGQLRERAGVPGAPLYTAGGRALGYYASTRVEVHPVQDLKGGGRRIKATVVKSKVADRGTPVTLDVKGRALAGV